MTVSNKSRTLFLLRFLHEYTDENHKISSSELTQVLVLNGFKADHRTIRDDINMLNDAGFNVVVTERNGVSTCYHYGTRSLETAELKILIDSVSSAQFLSKEMSDQLVSKLTAMVSRNDRERLSPAVYVSEHIKAPNNQLLHIVQRISDAIARDCRITFQYRTYNLEKEQIARHDGEWYTVSPYATVWMNDRYYLVGYSDRRRTVCTFRIDRMSLPRFSQTLRIAPPEGFRLQDYSECVFKMFGGPATDVTLRCRNETIDAIIDRFGKDVPIRNISEGFFETSVRVSVSAPFFAWVFQFGGNITILDPVSVKNDYLHMLKEASAT